MIDFWKHISKGFKHIIIALKGNPNSSKIKMSMFIFQVLEFRFPLSCKMKWAREKKKKKKKSKCMCEIERGRESGTERRCKGGQWEKWERQGCERRRENNKHQPRHHTKALMNQIVGHRRNKCRKLCESYLTHLS